MTPEYAAFLAGKAVAAPMRGLAGDPDLAGHLFPFQQAAVAHALRAGGAGTFLDTGLGKTECGLEWSEHARRAGNGRALTLVPLAVARQTLRRAQRWGYEARVIRDQAEAGDGINICNYDRLDRLDLGAFSAIDLDEASILKSFTGKTTRALIERCRGHRFKLVKTATPAPNDHMELGSYSEFLGIMQSTEMLSRFFINDTSTASQEWRLKGHAVVPFWDWMASWARMAQRPADLGDMASDARFVLPPLEIVRHRAGASMIKGKAEGLLTPLSLSATAIHDVKRQTSTARAECVASFVTPDRPWVVWCDTDYEADALKATMPFAIEVRGSMSVERKEELIAAFECGQASTLITKASICGFGCDWSHCADTAFVGRNYSYETWYQAIRRFWRFGQTRPVRAHLVVAEGEAEIGRVIDRKAAADASMKRHMAAAMRRANAAETVRRIAYDPNHDGRLPAWLRSVA